MCARDWLLATCLLVGCHRGGGGADPDTTADLAEVADDSGAADSGASGDDLSAADLAGADLRHAADLRPIADLSVPPDLAWSPTATVDIFVDNFCRMDVVPKGFTVPAGEVLKLTYRNRSRDYPVDVWLSYGGGFLDLKQGTIWMDRFEHCSGPLPGAAYADITTACSRYRLIIKCL